MLVYNGYHGARKRKLPSEIINYGENTSFIYVWGYFKNIILAQGKGNEYMSLANVRKGVHKGSVALEYRKLKYIVESNRDCVFTHCMYKKIAYFKRSDIKDILDAVSAHKIVNLFDSFKRT